MRIYFLSFERAAIRVIVSNNLRARERDDRRDKTEIEKLRTNLVRAQCALRYPSVNISFVERISQSGGFPGFSTQHASNGIANSTKQSGMNKRQRPVPVAISEVNQLKVSRFYFRHPLNPNSNPPAVV